MGLFSFVTEAGSKLGGKIFDVAEDKKDYVGQVELSQDRVNELRQQNITENINESGIEVENLSVSVNGEAVTLAGQVKTQACYEQLALIAGNQFGIGEVDCQLEVDKPEPEATMYTVKSGDSLSKIAKAIYGDASKYMVIFEANKTQLDDPNKIYVGQNLRIPAL